VADRTFGLLLDDLVDHHCHGLILDDLDRAAFESLMNEAPGPSALGTTLFDSMLGLAVRRHCAPLLGLPSLAPADDYLRRRRELGGAEANARLMAAPGIGTLLVDTGIGPAGLCSPDDLASLCGGTVHEVVRLERLLEDVLAAGADDVAAEVTARLRSGGAVAAKSIAAYRVGLELVADKPSDDDLRRALSDVDPHRVAHPVVSAWLAHTAVELGLPLQLHVGYGDSDLDLSAADPLHLTAFLRATEDRGVPVLLLHCYPFHRHAAYLAQVFGHVFMDLGLAVHNTGALSTTLVRETLELVPFGKLLFSSDAYGLAELYVLGALLFRSAMTTVLGELVVASDLGESDAVYVAGLVARDNARRVYALDSRGVGSAD
jgi:predicted TIM-barrel fold metal-dependent hydrolase